MANHAEMQVRFDRVISAIRALIDSLTAQDAAWEELKKGTEGVYAESAIRCIRARQAFEDEMPTIDALLIALRDNHYKDPTWPADGEDDVKILRLAWCSIHKWIEAGKSFAPGDIDGMRNLCAALERARDSTLSSTIADGGDAIPQLALKGIVDGGDSALINQALKLPAKQRYTATMRKMLDEDRSYYEWSLSEWANHLGASKPTIQSTDAWREIMKHREQNKQDRAGK